MHAFCSWWSSVALAVAVSWHVVGCSKHVSYTTSFWTGEDNKNLSGPLLAMVSASPRLGHPLNSCGPPMSFAHMKPDLIHIHPINRGPSRPQPCPSSAHGAP